MIPGIVVGHAHLDREGLKHLVPLAAVVARRDMTSGAVLGVTERLTRLDALRALTVGGARLTFAEREAGMLAVGRRADLAVVHGDA